MAGSFRFSSSFVQPNPVSSNAFRFLLPPPLLVRPQGQQASLIHAAPSQAQLERAEQDADDQMVMRQQALEKRCTDRARRGGCKFGTQEYGDKLALVLQKMVVDCHKFTKLLAKSKTCTSAKQLFKDELISLWVRADRYLVIIS
jgi:hypothetical protein